MIVIGILLAIVGIGALAWLVFSLAVYALPFFVGVSAGVAVQHAGAGPIVAIAAGLAAAVATLVAGQLAFTVSVSPLVRLTIGLLYAAPAAFAGYHATHGIAVLIVSSEGWRQVVAMIGALVVGVTAAARMTLPDTRRASAHHGRAIGIAAE